MKTIPITDVSSRKYIEWQCGASKGMTLNRLAEVCGCFSHEQASFGCHHPSGSGDCLANSCPIAFVDYPEGATEKECDEYDQGYGDQIRMALNDENTFGDSDLVRPYWWREQRSADKFVRDIEQCITT